MNRPGVEPGKRPTPPTRSVLPAEAAHPQHPDGTPARLRTVPCALVITS